jgi:hypothetical protein
MKCLMIGASVLAVLACPPIAQADHTCSSTSNVCSHTVDTGSTPKVGLGGGGHTADKREWVRAPDDKYFVNARVTTLGSTGGKLRCEFAGSDGVQQRSVKVGDATLTMTFVKGYHVLARAETGSGAENIGRTAMMICGFSAEMTALPN